MSIIALQKSQPHPRRFIRNAVKALLIENTDLAGRWFCTRPHPVYQTELPAGFIYFPDEDSDDKLTQPKTYTRTLALITEVQITHETEIENSQDDFLDSRAFEIEAALMHDRYLGLGEKGFVADVSLKRTQCTDISFEGDVDIALIRLHWNIVYITDSWNPLTIDEFLRFLSEFDIPKGLGVRSSDLVTIREE